MTGKVIQGSFLGCQLKWSSSVQPKMTPSAFQAKTRRRAAATHRGKELLSAAGEVVDRHETGATGGADDIAQQRLRSSIAQPRGSWPSRLEKVEGKLGELVVSALAQCIGKAIDAGNARCPSRPAPRYLAVEHHCGQSTCSPCSTTRPCRPRRDRPRHRTPAGRSLEASADQPVQATMTRKSSRRPQPSAA